VEGVTVILFLERNHAQTWQIEQMLGMNLAQADNHIVFQNVLN
jgi:hypothetical protein